MPVILPATLDWNFNPALNPCPSLSVDATGIWFVKMVETEVAEAANPVGAGQVEFDTLPKTWNSFIEYPFDVPLVIPLIFTNLALTVPLDSLYNAVFPLTELTVVQMIPSREIFISKSFPNPAASQLTAILQML